MKTIVYTAEAANNTWSKQGYLFENGLFISIFRWFNKETYFCKQFQLNEIPETIGWGKGVMGAYTDYQFFKKAEKNEIELGSVKAKCSELDWINSNISGIKLENDHLLDTPSFNVYQLRRIQDILAISRSKGIIDVQNTQVCQAEDIKYMIVGDNPGINEVRMKKYFIGASGQALKRQFEEEGLVKDFYKECLIFNKTMLHTRQTAELIGIKSLLGEELFNEILTLSAKHVADVQKKLNVPILVIGLSELKEGKLLYPFWATLINEIESIDKLLLFKHPSHDHFVNQWKEEKLKHPDMNPLQLLNYIGRKNRSYYTK